MANNNLFSWVTFGRGTCNENVPETRRVAISSGALFTGAEPFFTGSSTDCTNGTMENASVPRSTQFLRKSTRQIQKVVKEINEIPLLSTDSIELRRLPWDMAGTQFLLLSNLFLQ
jgi:hypothetical protein